MIRGATVAILLALTAPAGAVDRDCPAGQTWSPNLGACVRKAAVRKRSPEESYYAAIDLLEGKSGAATRAAALLAGACAAKHGPSCTLLGFLHEGGRAGKRDARQALAFYDRACELGDADGCVSASGVHAKGLLGDPDPAGALPPLSRACELGSGRGCALLAEKYEQALGVPRDVDRARTLYRRALERLAAECPKSGPSCYQLGLSYAYGRGVDVDYAKAREVFTSGCDAGSGLSCYAVGYLLERGFGAPADAAAALPYHLRACEQYDSADGCHDAGAILAGQAGAEPARLNQLADRACKLAAAQCDLAAHLLATGKGGTTDQARATQTYVAACEAGNALACSAAASRIAHGEGVHADGKRATQIWERACETGSGPDCWQAGVAHRDGELVAKDLPRAFELFATGCVRKSAAACEDAAELALSGDEGTGKKDPARAVALFQSGCELGRGETCTRLGDIYRGGEGVPADPHRALTAYTAGCKRGDGDGCAAMARLHEAGPLEDLPEAFADRARACQLGDGQSCRALEALAARADATAETRGKAAALLRAACDATAHVEDACTTLAQSHAYGGLAGKDEQRAQAIATASCGRGYRPACLMVADFTLVGIGVVANPAAARQRYTALCDQDLPEACWKLGNVLAEAGAHEDAARLFRRACDAGLASACNSYGFALYTGRGVTWSVRDARLAYQRACDLQDDYGCANVGEMEQFGIGVPVDLRAAAAAYARSCTDDADAGCARLGELTERGLGGRKRDLAAARALYQRGCDADAPEACRALAHLDQATRGARRAEIAEHYQRAYDLALAQARVNPYYAYVIGTYYQDGVAVAPDRRAAARWFDQACDGRDPLGCLAAGEAYLAGTGVRRDRARAAAMFARACAAGLERGCARADAIPMSGHGCACRTGAADTGALWLMAAVAAALRRRSARGPG